MHFAHARDMRWILFRRRGCFDIAHDLHWNLIRRRGHAGRRHDLGKSPIHNQHFTKSTYHDVGGLEVAMDDAAGMSKSQRLSDTLDETHSFTQRQLERVTVERLAFHMFHAVESAAI